MTSHLTAIAAAPRHILLLAAVLVAGCGGGGGDSPSPPPSPETGSARFAQQCASTNNYASGRRYGSLNTEKSWIRAYIDESYLWYDEVPNVNAADPLFNDYTYAAGYSLSQYFDALLVTSKDRFSFMYPTSLWQQLAGSGIQPGYGIEWVADSDTPPRGIRIAYVQPGSPAAASGLRRGDTLYSADGVSADVASGTAADSTRERAMYPSAAAEPHSLVFNRAGTAGTISARLTSANVTMTPVPLDSVITTANGTRVGYVLFHDHVATSEAQLIAAVNRLRAANVTELVLDIRYNGGGYLYIASQLAYMMAGPARTANKVFERTVYNAKRSADNNSADARAGFESSSCIPDANFRCTNVAPLPTLGLSRVHVITRPGTCSASEAIINGLRGVDVDVRQIGSATCGKPYGFTAKDNCGISYFPIEFQGVNDKGFGDYANGFTPGGSGGAGVPGCLVADDLSKPLGDITEGMLAATLGYLASGSCPAAPASAFEHAQHLRTAAHSGVMQRGPLRENRIVLPREQAH
jgi:carboxyl-terminal processing protease